MGHDAQPLSPLELRQFLQLTLPAYSIPAVFVALPAMPLQINGKIDRQALLSIPFDPIPEAGDAAPRTELESIVSEIWSGVLGVSPISIHENFFVLGGQSLSAIRVLAQLRARGLEISLQTLFQSPTIAELAAVIERLKKRPHDFRMPPLQPTDNNGKASLSFSQQRLWFLEQLFPDTPLYSMPVALSINGAWDIGALERAWVALVERHAALRTKLEVNGDLAIQTFANRVKLETTEIRVDVLDDYLQAEALRPFKLLEEPLLRAKLFKIGAEQHVLLLNFHHLVADEWSIRVVLHDLELLYEASRGANGAMLPAVGAQYSDYVAWQNSEPMRREFDRQLEYWKQQLADAEGALELPLDRPRPKERRHSGGQYTLLLPQTTANELQSLGENLQATTFMCLLGAFFVLLQRYSGQSDLTIGSLVANRRVPELEHTVGLLVNTVALRLKCRPDATFGKLLAIVRDVTLNAFENQDVPFEEVVDALGVSRASNLQPLFQVVFSLEEAAQQSHAFGSLGATELRLETGQVKFDLR